MLEPPQPARRVPLRKCMGCNCMRPKPELLRVAHGTQGGMQVDLTGKAPGRGAYVCPDVLCMQKARRRRALEHAFKCKAEPGVYDALEEAVLAAVQNKAVVAP